MVVVEGFIFATFGWVNGMNHVVLRDEVGAATHHIGLVEELHFDSVKADSGIYFFTEVMGEHDTHGAKLSEQNFSSLLLTSLIPHRPLHL